MDGRFMPFPHVIAGDIKHLKRIGVKGVLSQHAWPWAFNLNVYTLGKMLWKPRLTADAIIDEYCQRYGPAAGEMKRYIACMEKNHGRPASSRVARRQLDRPAPGTHGKK